MSYLRAALMSCLSSLAVLAAASPASDAETYLCKQQYALCTSARCVPQPEDPSKAVCSCDVEEGPSMSTEPCDTLLPSTDANGVQTVYSTFALDQAAQGKNVMTCPAGTPWTQCLNKPCTVDPAAPGKAICACDVVRTDGEWVTFGGDCRTATCESGYWSGATVDQFETGNTFMTGALGLETSPAQWCR